MLRRSSMLVVIAAGVAACVPAALKVPPVATYDAIAADRSPPPRVDVAHEATLVAARGDASPDLVLHQREETVTRATLGPEALVPRTVRRGGQDVQIGEPDRVMQDWIEQFGYVDATFCPLVLSLDGREPQLSPTPGADFELVGEWACEGTDWPDAASPWLVMDRDGNGSIDGGHELFGSGTRMPTGELASDGFVALAVVDEDGDGRITAADPQWGALGLWRDRNRDRRVDPGELTTLDDEGVVELGLEVSKDAQCDLRGNCAIERAGVSWRDGGGELRRGVLIDVHLRCR